MNKTLSILVVALVVGMLYCSPASADEPKPSKSNAPPEFHWPKVVISKETTYFTGPLRKDGGVDYVAALNRRYAEGVTPENNAAVALLQAAGPAYIDKKIRKRYFEMLGIPELPEKGEYLADFGDLPEFKAGRNSRTEARHSGRRLGSSSTPPRRAPGRRTTIPCWPKSCSGAKSR